MSKKKIVTNVVLVIIVMSALSIIDKKIMKKQPEILVEANQRLEIEKESKLETDTQIEAQEENVAKTNEQLEKDIEAFLLTKDQEDSWLYEITTPTGEPNRKYHVEYAIVHSTKDGIPELHIRNPREYDVLSFTNGEERQIFFGDSSGGLNTVQKDGTIVKFFYDRWTYRIGIEFSQIDLNGNEYDNRYYGYEDTNSNGSIDVEDYFSYNGEQIECDEWKTLCDGYIDIEKGLVGGFVIEDEAEWKILQEEVR